MLFTHSQEWRDLGTVDTSEIIAQANLFKVVIGSIPEYLMIQIGVNSEKFTLHYYGDPNV